MNQEQLQALLLSQRQFFSSGKTLPVSSRKAALSNLERILKSCEPEIYAALSADLGKSQTESYMCELGMVYSELHHMLHHLASYAKEKRAPTPLAQFPARSYVKPCPRGVVLIMSPWNYPLLLTLDPLIEALAAGNTAIVKPSAYAPATSRLLETIISTAFPPEYAAVITGGREENQLLLEQEFDYIFFTGSQAVGKLVYRSASRSLTPVSLELGGKSPCLVDQSADLNLAARRIVFGKFLNCGQTCVAPDYILCHESVASALSEALKAEIQRQFGSQPLQNKDYGKIISQKHFDRLSALLDTSHVSFGGRKEESALRIEPTLVAPCNWDDPVMQEEIFGPLLPILTYQSLDEAIRRINALPHPLALYFFSRDKAAIREVTARCPYGGGCINDTVIHLATPHMGFGGVGMSGMGAYHGKAGFDTFSHFKSIVDKKCWLDLPMRYQPYTRFYDRLIHFFMK